MTAQIEVSRPESVPTKQRESWRRALAPLTAGAVIGLGVALAVSVHFDGQTGVAKIGLLLPLFVAVPAVIAVLVLLRFEAFVLCLLLIRDSVDSAKTGGTLEPTVVLATCLILAGTFWLLAQRSEHAPTVRRMPITRAGAIFAGAALLSVVTSEQPKTSLLEWARLVSVIMMLAVLERLFASDPAAIRRALVAVYASLLVPAAFGVLQRLTHRHLSFADGIPRVHGTFGHPNSFAMYLAFLVVMGVALLPAVRGRWRWALAGAVLVAVVSLYFTQTRGSWIGAVVGVLLVLWLRSKKLFVVSIVLLAVVAALPPISSRFSDLSHEKRASGVAGNSLVWRIEHWGEALQLSKDRPVTGIGLKMVEVESPDGKLPHNDYVRAYVEGGALGLVTYLGLLGSFVLVSLRALRRAAKGLPRGIAVGFAGCTVALIVISMSDNLMTQSVVLWYFAVFAAAASSVAHRKVVSPPNQASEVDRAQ